MDENNLFDKIYIPWHKKIWMKILFFHWDCKGYVHQAIFKIPENRQVIDRTVEWIKDDIEFGYDAKTIYEKILLGQYDNTPIKENI